jgi:hypothetical protein
MTSSLQVDLQIAAIGKRRTMIIFAKIYRFKYFYFCNKVQKNDKNDFMYSSLSENSVLNDNKAFLNNQYYYDS